MLELAPIGGPSAWHADDFRDSDDWMLELRDDDRAEIDEAVRRSRPLDIQAIGRDDFALPGLSSRLAALRTRIKDGAAFGYVRGIPVERYDRETQLRVYWGISRHIGDPVPQNRNGHMIGHVIDVGDRPDDVNRRLTQSNAELAFHSDSCDVVGLLCVRTAMRGGTSAIVSAIAVHDEMLRRDPELCAALYEPVVLDRRGEVPPGATPWFEMPVFTRHNGRFNGYGPLPQYIESSQRFADAPRLTERQRAAIDLFYAICAEDRFCLRIPFKPGDIQYLQNHLIFHSRTAYEDWPDSARKRHLIRMWLSLPDGRELPPIFLNKWTNITMGTRRGGAIVAAGKTPMIPFEPETRAFA
ncbi:MAG: TauD/TfdA family dioxygenase [Reyranellaceae bacterium]